MSAADDKHRLEVAERQLALVHSMIPRADNKVSALWAIVSAQIVVAALNVSVPDMKIWYVAIPVAGFAFLAAGAYVHLYRCAFPSLEGGTNSLTYFAEIAKLREAEFIDRYTAIPVPDLIKDICGQIWRNSEIAKQKFESVRAATKLAMWAALPWVCVLAATAFEHSRMPLITK